MESNVNESSIQAQTVAENINVTGKQVALRDIYVNQLSTQGHFVTVNTASYSSSLFAIPVFAEQLISKVRSNRLLLLTQVVSFDTASLLRYLALQLKTEQIEILELDSSKEKNALLKEFPKQGGNKVFVLDHIHPQAIDFDLSRLIQLATQHNYYFLISTEVSETVWQIKRNAFYDCWFTIPTHDLYAPAELLKDLLRKLEKEKESIEYLKEEELSLETFLSKQKKVQEVAEAFSKPEQINLFIYQLSGLADLPEEKQLEKAIAQSTDDSAPAIVKWFHSLPASQKLIAIGACLLEGVYDDQFFQLISEVVESNWKHRNSSLLALDYCDLEFLYHYFEFDDYGDGKRILKSKYPEQRLFIIEAAWDSYRRHILHALPVLIDAARETIISTEVNWEKFGTQHRRMTIRQAVGNTVSDIGIHSLETVEHALLEFAAVSEITLQRITAKAMARWREYNEDDLLFDTLERWINSDEIRQTMEEFLKMEKIATINKSSTHRALNYIRSTSVLTLGYAANYDPPGELSQRVIDLLQKLIGDRESQVRDRVKVILPRLIHQHTERLLPFITEELIKEDDLQELISETLADLYDEVPGLIQLILKEWLEECLNSSSEENRRHKYTHRDKVLVTALKTYQKINLEQEGGAISIPELYQYLIRLHKNEGRAGVKHVIWETLIYLLQIDYREAEEHLPALCSEPFSLEADLVVRAFTKIYLEERMAQESLTQYRLSLSDWEEELPVWLSPSQRPLTSVELGVQKLLESEVLSNRQLAARILWEYTKELDKEEYENLFLARSIEREKTPTSDAEETGSAGTASYWIPEFPQKPLVSLWIRLWIYLLCFREGTPKRSREELKAFYLTFRKKGLKSPYTHFLLKKWQGHTAPSIRQLSERLQFLIKRAFV